MVREKEWQNEKSRMFGLRAKCRFQYNGLFLYSMKSPLTREKYQRRLASFLEHANIQGDTLQSKVVSFSNKAATEPLWAFNTILRFLEVQNTRVNNKQISGATVRNYVKAIKLFCEMADIPIPWKKLTQGLPRARNYADDRIPSLEEIKKLMEYPDRRIKPNSLYHGLFRDPSWSMGLLKMG
jgi:hypothetical protein